MDAYIRELAKVTPFVYSNRVHTNNLISPMHVHSEMEIVHVKTGTMKIKTFDEKEINLTAGEFAIFNCDYPHETVGEYLSSASLLKFSLPYYIEKFTPAEIDFSSFYKTDNYRYFMTGTEEAEELKLYFDILNTYSSAHNLHEYCHGAINLIIGLFKKCGFINVTTNVESKHIKKILPVIRHIKENYDSEITLDYLADKFGYNKNYLSKIFKNVTGKTIVEFVNNIRLEKAREEMGSTNKTITDIAMDSGFSSPAYFIKLFKRKYLCTPYVYRKFRDRSY